MRVQPVTSQKMSQLLIRIYLSAVSKILCCTHTHTYKVVKIYVNVFSSQKLKFMFLTESYCCL